MDPVPERPLEAIDSSPGVEVPLEVVPVEPVRLSEERWSLRGPWLKVANVPPTL
jgi:hypothetical protein